MGSVLFESFSAGYLKRLDLKIAMNLKPLSLRLYRFLDKHFNPPARMAIKYNVRTLAYERLGMPRTYDIAQVRRNLAAAIDELIDIGYLVKTTNDQLFTKRNSTWEVKFILAKSKTSNRSTRGRFKTASVRGTRPEHRIFRNGKYVNEPQNAKDVLAASKLFK